MSRARFASSQAFATLATFAVALACAAALPERAGAAAVAAKLDIRADDIAFYPYANDALLAARGHVLVKIGSREIEAGALRLDLTKNRLTAADDVRVRRGGHELTGSAYALDLATGDAALLRTEPVPTTYRLPGDDLASAFETPPAPETFDAVDLDGQRPFMRSHRALVTPNGAVRMTPVEFPTAAGPSLRLPTYVYTLVQNPYIAQNAAPPASFDQPYLLAGTPNSLTAANLRYDADNGVTLGFDEHLVDGQRAYVAGSILPLRDRQLDVTAFEVLRPGLQQTFTTVKTFGANATTAGAYRLQESGPFAIATLSASLLNASNAAELELSTYAHDVGRYFTYQLRTSYGYDHNYAGYPFSNDFRTSAGGFVASPPLRLLGTSLGAKYEYLLTAYDFPHEVTDGTVTLTLARSVAQRIDLLGTMQFEQNDNRYRDVATGTVALGLPGPSVPYETPDGTFYPGYYAFSGLNTYRKYALTTTLRGRGDNRVQLTLTHTHDFPQFGGLGRPPFELDLDVKARLTPALAVELGRSYDFGWGGRYLSPEYSFAISP